MRPSELKAAKTPAVEDDGKKKYLSSTRADPPITAAEAQAATVAVCRWHDGLVRVWGAKDGAVFFCGTGKQYWRWRKRDQGFWRRLKVPRRGIV
jgi:hypothetical protein